MKATLRLRLVGPQQSWGTRSRFDHRDTELAPTKSGVIGLLAAALGRARDEDITDLAELRMGVRADSPGVLLSDYHTALDVVQSDGKSGGTVVSRRAFLADAAFLVGLESDQPRLLSHLFDALLDPHWPLGLGRRAFPPSLPPVFRAADEPAAIVNQPLTEALVSCPPLNTAANERQLVRYYLEDVAGEQLWFDQPLDNFRKRSFGPRRVRVIEARWGEDVPESTDA